MAKEEEGEREKWLKWEGQIEMVKVETQAKEKCLKWGKKSIEKRERKRKRNNGKQINQ